MPDEPQDLYGHATACAGIVVGLAPEVELYSVRVLGADLRGKGAAFLAGLEWAVEKGVHAMNLSLSSKSERLFPYFHEVVDDAPGGFSWKLEQADYLSRLDGAYRFAADGSGTEVGYVLAVDVTLPLPGFMKRAAAGLIVNNAMKQFKVYLEADGAP